MFNFEVSLLRYVWRWAERTTKAERYACIATFAILAICASVAGMLASRSTPGEPDDAPWNISRKTWGLGEDKHGTEEETWPERLKPVRLVVVQHTAGPECHKFGDCAGNVRNLQEYFFKEKKYDLPYNFLVGNEGRVYEGRGWDVVGAHTYGFNRCAIGLGFMGDYRSSIAGARPTSTQLQNVLKLLSIGVKAGILHERYQVLAALDLQTTASPGDTLYNALRVWPSFQADENGKRFRNKNCDVIYDMLDAEESKVDAANDIVNSTEISA